jgi:protein-ribulosamine 3-kinase
LVHGDLWQGNFSFDHAGVPLIYDPACYYAVHEVDLAMLELFGDPGVEFFDAYSSILPIDKGYSQRKKIYNLYHILNHANFLLVAILNRRPG